MKKTIIIAVVLLALLPASVFAAQIFFGTHEKTVGLSQKFEVGVFLDTHGESINALEGHILFPADALEFNGLYTGSSVLPFWVESPKLISDGVVSFSGVVPGGFSGGKGYLFSLLFTAKKSGQATISTTQEKILLNDGAGSAVAVTKAPLSLTIENRAGESSFTPKYDAEAPEAFQPQVSQDTNIFNNQYFLTFATQDKGSGIDHYEVAETKPWYSLEYLFSATHWQLAESPYLLQDQTAQSIILVKAVDLAGNQRLARVLPLHYLPWYENDLIWIIILLLIVALGYWGIRFYISEKI